MRIETKRLTVRDFSVADAEALYKLKYDEQVLKYDPTFVGRGADMADIEEAIAYFVSVKGSKDFKREIYYAIAISTAETVVGAITVSVTAFQDEMQMGWMMRGEFTGRGFASEAGKAVSDHLLAALNLDYMVAVMDTDNPASFRTAQKSGFRLFEKRIPYDYHYRPCRDDDPAEVSAYFKSIADREVCDGYYYFRKYNPASRTKIRFYGDTVYDGRFA